MAWPLLSTVDMLRSARVVSSCLCSLLIAGACGTGDLGNIEDGERDGVGGKEDSVVMTPAEVAAVLALVNDPTRDKTQLREEAGLSARVATNIVTHRDGADGTPGTDDDDRFDDLGELDAVPYVGTKVLKALLLYAKALGLVGNEGGGSAGGCGDRGWRREIVHSSPVTGSDLDIGASADGQPWLVFAANLEAMAMRRAPNGSWTSHVLDGQAGSVTIAVAPDGGATFCTFSTSTQTRCRDVSATGQWSHVVGVGPIASDVVDLTYLGKVSLAADGGLLLPYATKHYVWDQWGWKNYTHHEIHVAYRAPGEVAFSDGFKREWGSHTVNADHSPPRMVVGFDDEGGQHAALNDVHFQRPDSDTTFETDTPKYLLDSLRPDEGSPDELAVAPDGTLWRVKEIADPLGGELRVELLPPGSQEWEWEYPGVGTPNRSFQVWNHQTPDLAVDSRGRIHVVAVGSDASPLYTVRETDGRWKTERIDGENIDTRHTRLAIDSVGGVHVAYWDKAIGSVIYARRCGQ